jgi:hypothetical protein
LNSFEALNLTVNCEDVFIHPGYEVIFECSFDELMKKVGGHELMDVSSREVVSEWLLDGAQSEKQGTWKWVRTHNDIISYPIAIPESA